MSRASIRTHIIINKVIHFANRKCMSHVGICINIMVIHFANRECMGSSEVILSSRYEFADIPSESETYISLRKANKFLLQV